MWYNICLQKISPTYTVSAKFEVQCPLDSFPIDAISQKINYLACYFKIQIPKELKLWVVSANAAHLETPSDTL